MLSWLSFWPIKAIVIVLVTGLTIRALAKLSHRSRPNAAGWHRVRPGAAAWICLLLGGSLLGIFAYVRLFVGSARVDAERQMLILTLLITALAIGLVCTVAAMLRSWRQRLEWRDRSIKFRLPDGSRVLRSFADVEDLERAWSGKWRLRFDGGTAVEFYELDSGAGEFLEALIGSGELAPAGAP